MKTLLKYFFLILFGLLLLTFACKDDKSEILTVASELPKSLGYEINPTYWVKFQGENEWRTIVEEIRGFNYAKGYEYKIEVKKENTPGYNPHTIADQKAYYYVLIHVISEEKKDSAGIPESVFKDE